MESFRVSSPGPDAKLPGFIVDRMIALKIRPTLTQLAIGSGVPIATLRANLNGESAMKLITAIKLAAFLQCGLEQLVSNAKLC